MEYVTSSHTHRCVLSHGTIVLYSETPLSSPLPLYDCPVTYVSRFASGVVSGLLLINEHVYRVLGTGGFPWKSVTPRITTEVEHGVYLVEWGDIVHVVKANTPSDAEHMAITMYTDDWLCPVIISTKMNNEMVL